jgi:hypothetical protein
MGRRGPKPDFAKREAFARLIAEGVPSERGQLSTGADRARRLVDAAHVVVGRAP